MEWSAGSSDRTGGIMNKLRELERLANAYVNEQDRTVVINNKVYGWGYDYKKLYRILSKAIRKELK